MKTEIPFDQFLPDGPNYKTPGLIVCDNVYAVGAGYNPIQSLVGTGRTVTGEIRGSARFDLPDGTPILLVGTTTDLFVIRNKTVFASNLGLSLALGDYWTFGQFGFSIYATCKQYGLYRLDSILADNTFSASPGSPPKASSLDVVGDFLFLGNLTDIDGSYQPYRVRWSAFNNPNAVWETDVGRQSGYVDMESYYGEVTGIFGGRFDLIFQRHAVSRIWYTGGATVFAKDIIEDERGCPAPQSFARVGGAVYFLSHDGFCRTDGSGVEVISSERVWNWFKENSNLDFISRIVAAVDWTNKSIFWSFYGPTVEKFTRQIIYNWALDRWTTATFDADWVVSNTVTNTTIDDIDANVENDEILDVEGPSFDSPIYDARGRTLAAFVNGEFCEFRGANLKASFETGDFQPKVGSRSFVRSVYPIVEIDDGDALASIAGRDRLGDLKAYGDMTAQGYLGFCPVISDARFHSVKIEIPSGLFWEKASGFQIDWEASGIA